MIERVGEAFEFDAKLTVCGRRLTAGDRAPEFELENFDPVSEQIWPVKLSDSAGSIRLLSVINSIDTPVCHIETLRWSKEALDSSNLMLITISMDLPFALARWQKEAQVQQLFLSAHRSEEFGIDYGVLLKEWRLLQRAVFVIDGEGVVRHAEYVADQMQEPDYSAAVKRALG